MVQLAVMVKPETKALLQKRAARRGEPFSHSVRRVMEQLADAEKRRKEQK